MSFLVGFIAGLIVSLFFRSKNCLRSEYRHFEGDKNDA